MQARTSEGLPRYSLVKQRNGIKYTVKRIKEDKDYTFRDYIASLILKVFFKAVTFCKILFLFSQSIENGTSPNVVLPLGQNIPSVRPMVKKPDKKMAIAKHQSRFL